jgi:hypothetical protein
MNGLTKIFGWSQFADHLEWGIIVGSLKDVGLAIHNDEEFIAGLACKIKRN